MPNISSADKRNGFSFMLAATPIRQHQIIQIYPNNSSKNKKNIPSKLIFDFILIFYISYLFFYKLLVHLQPLAQIVTILEHYFY